jgi:hypothetical protein
MTPTVWLTAQRMLYCNVKQLHINLSRRQLVSNTVMLVVKFARRFDVNVTARSMSRTVVLSCWSHLWHDNSLATEDVCQTGTASWNTSTAYEQSAARYF